VSARGFNQGTWTRLGYFSKGKVFGILSQLKKLSKSNDLRAQNRTFLAVRNALQMAVLRLFVNR
jgi:hypothetical protein